MANDVCDCVGLPCAGRTLHGHTGGTFETLDYSDLLVIVWKWEVQFLRTTVPATIPATRQAPKADRLELQKLIGGSRYKSEGAILNQATTFQFLLQALQILEKVVYAARPRWQHSSLG